MSSGGQFLMSPDSGGTGMCASHTAPTPEGCGAAGRVWGRLSACDFLAAPIPDYARHRERCQRDAGPGPCGALS